MKKAVSIMPVDDWVHLIHETGDTTKLVHAPLELGQVENDVLVAAIAASGNINTDPGIDIVRHDPDDTPYIYNIDHYIVIENLPKHELFEKVISTAGVSLTDDLNKILSENVFIVGPYKDSPDHWAKEISRHIQEAKLKK